MTHAKIIKPGPITSGPANASQYRPRRCPVGLHHLPPSEAECAACRQICRFAPPGTAEKTLAAHATKMFLRMKGGVARAARYQAAMSKGA